MTGNQTRYPQYCLAEYSRVHCFSYVSSWDVSSDIPSMNSYVDYTKLNGLWCKTNWEIEIVWAIEIIMYIDMFIWESPTVRVVLTHWTRQIVIPQLCSLTATAVDDADDDDAGKLLIGIQLATHPRCRARANFAWAKLREECVMSTACCSPVRARGAHCHPTRYLTRSDVVGGDSTPPAADDGRQCKCSRLTSLRWWLATVSVGCHRCCCKCFEVCLLNVEWLPVLGLLKEIDEFNKTLVKGSNFNDGFHHINHMASRPARGFCSVGDQLRKLWTVVTSFQYFVKWTIFM